MPDVGKLVGRVVGSVKVAADRAQRRYPWLAHAVAAWAQLGNTNGSLLAGALTFISFLALFPLVLLAVSVTGFVLGNNDGLRQQLFARVTAQVPGQFGDTLRTIIDTAISARTGIGVVGLVGLVLTGLGWISNLRLAIEQVWGHPVPKRSFLGAKLADLSVLAGLGAGLLVSVGLTASGTALTGLLLRVTHLADVPGAGVATRVLTIAVAVAADMVIFGFLIVRLPRASLPRSLVVRSALLAAVGFEILKIVGTYYIKRVSSSPTYGTLGTLIGVLVWLNLVFRFLLYCTAWTATATPPGAGGVGYGGYGHIEADPVRAVPALPASDRPAAAPLVGPVVGPVVAPLVGPVVGPVVAPVGARGAGVAIAALLVVLAAARRLLRRC